jgi:hypothetical protein
MYTGIKTAVFMTTVIISGAVAAPRPSVLAAWETDYQQLQDRLLERDMAYLKGLPKSVSGAGSKILDRNALILDGDRSPVDIAIRRIGALLNHLKTLAGAPDLSELEMRFYDIRNRWQGSVLAKTSASSAVEQELYMALRKIGRQAALSNPLLNDVDDLLFLAFVITDPSHMCDQYYGWTAKNGGGLYILEDFKSDNPTLVNVLENSLVQNGRFAGQQLTGGAFLSPDLSWDAQQIVFAWTNEQDKCWHLFKVSVDGNGLTQLTDGEAPYGHLAYQNTSQNDFDPCWLPNGRIAFISERRGGYLRCSGSRPCPTYTLFSMKDDGSDIIPLSYHETNEWHPSLNNDGMIVYTRWDYVDRDDCIAHHFWICNPDGTDPRAPHGNYPVPYNTFDEPGYTFPVSGTGTIVNYDGRRQRPNGEWNIRAIPGSQKYVATAGGHHAHSFGQLVLLDTRIEDDNAMSQLTGITTDQTDWSDAPGPYGTAWPLSEDFYLCSFNQDLVLLDRFGNSELIWSAANVPGPVGKLIDPIPLAARDVPPVIPAKTHQGENLKESSPNATISIMNVNISDRPLPEGVTIKLVRIVQVIPQLQQVMNSPAVGYASESLVRMPLGVVPVEEDGSVYFKAPVAKEIYFQLLDEQGMAVHSMRSGTYVHPGEHLSCTGCHESKWEAIPVNPSPLALQRPPSEIEPEVSDGAVPFNWHILAKPVLEAKCGSCHNAGGQAPDLSYPSLQNYAFYWPYWSALAMNNHEIYVNGEVMASGSRTRPGRFGARESRLYKEGYLSSSHYNVDLSAEELRRITLWLDMNSNELGAYTRVDDQRQGQVVWPELDVDPDNPLGIENRIVSVHQEQQAQVRPLIMRRNGDRIIVSIPGAEAYNVSVTDFTGRRRDPVLDSNNGRLRPDSRKVSFSTRSFGPGVYMVIVDTEGKQYQEKLVVMQ